MIIDVNDTYQLAVAGSTVIIRGQDTRIELDWEATVVLTEYQVAHLVGELLGLPTNLGAAAESAHACMLGGCR